MKRSYFFELSYEIYIQRFNLFFFIDLRFLIRKYKKYHYLKKSMIADSSVVGEQKRKFKRLKR